MVRKHTITKILKVKILMLVFLTFGAFCAFATLGDGKKKAELPKKKSLLSAQKNVTVNSRTFSIRSGYTFRGTRTISPAPAQQTYVNLKTVVTYQRGSTTYQVPVKKKVLLGGNLKVGIYASGSF